MRAELLSAPSSPSPFRTFAPFFLRVPAVAAGPPALFRVHLIGPAHRRPHSAHAVGHRIRCEAELVELVLACMWVCAGVDEGVHVGWCGGG